jgi:hypothetical protein
VNAYIVDPVTVDEWQPCARISGSPLAPRLAVGHALNTKAVARRYAREHGRAYPDLRLIVIHLGSGVTVSAHHDGKMIDNNTPEEGPFGPDRSGSLPVRELIKVSCSGAFTQKELNRKVFGEGGLFAYLGTRDLKEVERRIESGDARAAAVYDAMIYQIAKEAGAMAAVLRGVVDAVLLTGGIAYSNRVVKRLREYLDWIAPISVYPGEDELRALAEGVFPRARWRGTGQAAMGRWPRTGTQQEPRSAGDRAGVTDPRLGLSRPMRRSLLIPCSPTNKQPAKRRLSAPGRRHGSGGRDHYGLICDDRLGLRQPRTGDASQLQSCDQAYLRVPEERSHWRRAENSGSHVSSSSSDRLTFSIPCRLNLAMNSERPK